MHLGSLSIAWRHDNCQDPLCSRNTSGSGPWYLYRLLIDSMLLLPEELLRVVHLPLCSLPSRPGSGPSKEFFVERLAKMYLKRIFHVSKLLGQVTRVCPARKIRVDRAGGGKRRPPAALLACGFKQRGRLLSGGPGVWGKGPEGDAEGGTSRGNCGRNDGGDDGLILAALSSRESSFDSGIEKVGRNKGLKMKSVLTIPVTVRPQVDTGE